MHIHTHTPMNQILHSAGGLFFLIILLITLIVNSVDMLCKGLINCSVVLMSWKILMRRNQKIVWHELKPQKEPAVWY